MELLDYLRMSIRDLSPNEYMATSRHDYELADAVQTAWRMGTQDARDNHEAKGK